MIQISPPYSNALICNDDEALQDIHLKSKNIAIYQRDMAPLNKELIQIAERPIECRASGTANEILSVLTNYFNNNLPECSSLLEDASGLLRLFEKVTQASSFRLLLATINNNMCRKFHTDLNGLRLLCTYIGPGTLWLPDEVVDHNALQAMGNDLEMIVDGQQIQQVPTGDVVLLKGALYPEANPILHRSPAIEKSRQKRLLLRIDSNEFLNLFT